MQKGYAGELGHGWLPEATPANLNCSAMTGYGQDYYWTFDMQAHSVASPYPRIYKKISYNPCDPTAASMIQTVPLYTVIIGMNRGEIEYIAWDDGCFFCAENGADCISTALNLNGTAEVNDRGLRGCRQEMDTSKSPPQDSCYPTVDTSVGNSTNATASVSGANVTSPCDLKVFVTWTGTDRHGKFMRSSGQRFSRYRAFGVASLYQGALNLGQDAMNLANRALDVANAIPGRIAPGSDGGRRRLVSEEVQAQAQAQAAPQGGASQAAGGDDVQR